MARTDELEQDAKLTIDIKGSRGIKRCPYCGTKPTKVEWSKEGLRIWCRNDYCTGGHYKIFTPIVPEELDLKKVTRQLLVDWGTYCDGIIQQRKGKEASVTA